MTITFEVAGYGSCEIPMLPITPTHNDCEPATLIVRDSDNNVLYILTVDSGATETQVIADSTYLVEYENGTPIESGSILAEGSAVIQVPNPITCVDAVVNVNSVFFDNVASGGALNIEVRKSTGNDLVGSKQGQYWRIGDSTAVLKTSGGATISTTPIKAEESEDITAPDATLEVNGTPEGTFAAGSTIEVNITDGVNPVTPNDVTVVGDVVTIEVPAATPAPVGATLTKTGQTTSYRTGDDGDIEAGRATSFLVLASNNPFGNTNRFTDELGGSTYTNNIVIDWSTYNGATVLGWDRRVNGGGANTDRTWNQAIDEAFAHSVGTFTSGWRLCNRNEAMSICNDGASTWLNYAPFNFIAAQGFWLSSTRATATTNSTFFFPTNHTIVGAAKSSGGALRWLACRTFTVTGTTLT
jgi:hypothetical protein